MNKKVFITMEDTKMGISGITSGYPMGYKTKRAVKNISGKGFDNAAINGTDDLTAKRRVGITQQTSVMDIFNSMSRFAGSITKSEETKNTESVSEDEKNLKENDDKVMSDEELEKADNQESETKSDIIVKPDGSRVLVVTMSIGGMETTMSMEISKPTDTLNETENQEVTDENNQQSAISDGNLIENQVTDVSM